MLFKITEITDTEVVFTSVNKPVTCEVTTNEIAFELEKEVRFDIAEIDMVYSIKVGFEIDMSGDGVPFSISQYCRDEIREHRQEEARNGDI